MAAVGTILLALVLVGAYRVGRRLQEARSNGGHAADGPATGIGRAGQTQRRRKPAAALAFVAAGLAAGAVVAAHDAYCYVTFDQGRGVLCERPDGTTWRDPSSGCGHWEDPRCPEGTVCPDSRFVGEPAAESCAWLLMKQESPATTSRG